MSYHWVHCNLIKTNFLNKSNGILVSSSKLFVIISIYVDTQVLPLLHLFTCVLAFTLNKAWMMCIEFNWINMITIFNMMTNLAEQNTLMVHIFLCNLSEYHSFCVILKYLHVLDSDDHRDFFLIYIYCDCILDVLQLNI